MIIKNIEGPDAWAIAGAIRTALQHSRFAANLEIVNGPHHTDAVKIETVRLKGSKPYCGNHPNECEVNPFVNRKPSRAKYLEGADWVEFDDIVNDVLDTLKASARFESCAVVARKGARRRTRYDSHVDGPFWVWDKEGQDEDYSDFRGLPAPRSEYPEGTPGGPSSA